MSKKPDYKYYSCYYEGLQESKYFEHLKHLIHEKNGFCNIKIIPHFRKYKNVLKDVSNYDCSLVFDHDNNEEEFKKNLAISVEFNRVCEAKRNNRMCYCSYSNISFDLWLLLHTKDGFSKPVNCANDYVSEIRKRFDLPCGVDTKEEKVIDAILSKISIDDVVCAVNRAVELCKRNEQTKEKHCCNDNIVWYDNPDTGVHLFVKDILKAARIID